MAPKSPQLLLHFLIHVDAPMLCRKFELLNAYRTIGTIGRQVHVHVPVSPSLLSLSLVLYMFTSLLSSTLLASLSLSLSLSSLPSSLPPLSHTLLSLSLSLSLPLSLSLSLSLRVIGLVLLHSEMMSLPFCRHIYLSTEQEGIPLMSVCVCVCVCVFHI